MSTRTAALLLRLALAAGFASAVADRFGLWGPAGAPDVAWGNFDRFTSYVAHLNFFAPATVIPVLAWTATLAEVILAVLLVAGWRLRIVAFLSAALLLSFALTMAVSDGIKAPLDSSVFTAAAAALMLGAWAGPAPARQR